MIQFGKKYKPWGKISNGEDNIILNLINILGGVSEVAKIAKCKRPQVVYTWIYNKKIPANKVMILCKKTGMKILPEHVRPDYFSC